MAGADTSIDIPGFVLEEELGRGAYSIVYRARCGLELCALKVARRGGDPARWFRREAVALARVRDPGLPLVLEVGEARGVPYLVMELVEGETLASRLRSGLMRQDEAVALGRGLGRSLGAVHARGLVHRDVKPRNVILGPRGEVRLVDFGFARPIDRVFTDDVVGTHAYAAPEQLASSAPIDGRADLYALGCVLVASLTGAPPRRGEPPAALAGVSAELNAVLFHLLSRAPAARYAGASAFLADLARLEGGMAPLGPGAYPPERIATVPLVGRDAERLQLHQAWADAKRGWGRCVLVAGPRGSGKSRLVAALADEAAADAAHVLRAKCEEGDSRPGALLRALIDVHLANIERLPSVERARAVEALRRSASGHLAPLLASVSPALGQLLGETGATSREADYPTAEGVVEFFMRLLRSSGPTLVSIDDLQWIDPVSREVLVRVAHRAAEVRTLVVAAARPNEAGSSVGRFTLSLGERLTVLELEPLAPETVASITHAYLGTSAVDPAFVQRVSVLADGTPLGCLEVFEAFVDAGALAPHWRTWQFDRVAAERARLPRGTLALLARRIETLPPATRRILECAALAGSSFEDALVAPALDLGERDVAFAVADAKRAGLVEPGESGSHRFVHDTVREALLAGLKPAAKSALHQRMAEALEARGAAGGEAIYALAAHYAAGDPARSPRRAYETCRIAGERALASFDNETALRFFATARDFAKREALQLDVAFDRNVGEACLRIGALDESLDAFGTALTLTRDAVETAALLGRIAWVHQMRADADAAWSALAQAFEALGHRMPVEDAGSVVGSALRWAEAMTRREGRGVAEALPARRATLEVLCDLHYQNARLGLDHGKPVRLVESAVQALGAAEQLGPSRALARSRAVYGVVTTVLGLRALGARYLGTAQQMAESIGDPATVAYCVQLQFVGACWAGEIDRALELASESLDARGHWLEVSEYCSIAGTAHLLEVVRGRTRSAWGWVDRAIERVRRHGEIPAAFFQHVLAQSCATLVGLGREAGRRDLLRRFGSPATCGDHHAMSWGSRVREYTEPGNLDRGFEAVVAAFEREGNNPRRAHIGLAEYYVALAHARIHQCLRAGVNERAAHVERLKRALGDLRAMARIPLLRAHVSVVEGYAAWFTGSAAKARRLLGDAEALARRESCPWVLYEVARCRAHMLRAEGRDEPARAEARLAVFIASEHGAVHRARFVREEFALDRVVSTASGGRAEQPRVADQSSRRSWRQLQALVEVARAGTRCMRLDVQARAIVDELVRNLDAEHGVLVFDGGRRAEGMTIARTRRETDLADLGPRLLAAVDRVRESAALPDASGEVGGPGDALLGADCERLLAVPLRLQDRVVGVVCVERTGLDRAFNGDDADLLMALAHQVPVALELGRALEERERLGEALRQSQKMEAVGQLAGGIAHDLNNMVAAIRSALERLPRTPEEDGDGEVAVIEAAALRATELTSQLLTFARRKDLNLALVNVDEVVLDLAPLLRRLIGVRVVLEVEVRAGEGPVRIDRASFEQAIVNIAINARDAMPEGGTLTVSTRAVVVASEDGQHRGLAPGSYACIRLSDTGSGMSAEVRERIFEPFFTTKPPGVGTGLGLAMVYGFVRQSEGQIGVESESGGGSSFAIYLPVADGEAPAAVPASRTRAHVTSHVPPANETILLVDDEPLVRTAMQHLLESGGYRVLAAGDAAEATRLARMETSAIRLVITDVLMPGMTGPELARCLADLGLQARVLYVSGYAASMPPGGGTWPQGVEFLKKPFEPSALFARVRALLDAAPEGPVANTA